MASDSIPLATLLHMATIKLSPSNYLLWRHQMIYALRCGSLQSIVDGTDVAPPRSILSDGKEVPNPDFVVWTRHHDKAMSLLLSSLTEESMTEVLGLTTVADVWAALEAAFCPSSQSRSHQLRDEIQFLKRGSSSVADFARKFNSILHQLAAIGESISEGDKVQWFLRGLGSQYRTFVDVQLAIPAAPNLRDLIARARDHELRNKLLDSTDSNNSSVAFFARQSPGQQNRQSSGRNSNRGRNSIQSGGQPAQTPNQSAQKASVSTGGSRHTSQSSGSSDGGRRNFTPRCQICRGPHYATVCQDRYKGYPTTNLSQMFDAQCNLSAPQESDWFVDSGASAHMTPSTSALDQFTLYNESHNQGNSGKGQV